MARILFTTFGSFGDLHPYLAVGSVLRERGHRVVIGTSGTYAAKVAAEGIGFEAIRPDVSLDNRAMLEYVFDRRRGSERVIRVVCERLHESYEDTLRAAASADVIVTHPITLASVVAAEKLGMPWISSVLAPISFISAYDPPVAANALWTARLRVFGPGFMKWFWDLGRRQTLGWVRPVHELRRAAGLDPGEHPLFEGSHAPGLVLALFSKYFAEPQPDWPPATVVTGFPFFDAHHQRRELPPDLLRFFDSGPAPVVFTLGSSAVGAAGAFYRESLAAVRRLGVRAVLLTGSHRQGLPDQLPGGVMGVEYAPHSEVFPRAAAVVHQGGIGTMGQALRSGRPMLVVPFAHDQFDNAERARRLGCAQVLYRFRYTARRTAKKLRQLLEQPAYADAAAAIGDRIRSEDGAAAAADAVEEFMRSRAIR